MYLLEFKLDDNASASMHYISSCFSQAMSHVVTFFVFNKRLLCSKFGLFYLFIFFEVL